MAGAPASCRLAIRRRFVSRARSTKRAMLTVGAADAVLCDKGGWIPARCARAAAPLAVLGVAQGCSLRKGSDRVVSIFPGSPFWQAGHSKLHKKRLRPAGRGMHHCMPQPLDLHSRLPTAQQTFLTESHRAEDRSQDEWAVWTRSCRLHWFRAGTVSRGWQPAAGQRLCLTSSCTPIAVAGNSQLGQQACCPFLV